MRRRPNTLKDFILILGVNKLFFSPDDSIFDNRELNSFKKQITFLCDFLLKGLRSLCTTNLPINHFRCNKTNKFVS